MPDDHHDVIIIGGGPGGGSMAHGLAPTSKRILILERGSHPPRESPAWNAETVFVDGESPVDQEGNGWTAAGGGVHRVPPGGDLLGTIRVPVPVADPAFGGRDRAQMVIGASQTPCSIDIPMRGAQRP